MNNLISKAGDLFLAPVKAFRLRYLPLLMIYFAYGASAVIDVPLTFFLKEKMSFSAAQIASVAVWASVPWTVKMIFGQMLDSVPLFGSRRKAYVFLGALFTAAGLLLLTFLAGGSSFFESQSVCFAAFLFAKVLIVLGFVIQDSTADTMTTEVVARKGRLETDVKHDLAMVQILGRIALYFGILATAQLSGLLVMWMSKYSFLTFSRIFSGALIVPLISCVGAFAYRRNSDQEEILNVEGFLAGLDKKIFSAALVLGCVSALLGILKIFLGNTGGLLLFADEMMFLISGGILIWMVKYIMKDEGCSKKRLLYMTLVALFAYRLTPQVGEGLVWWAVDVLKFSPSFFGVLRLLASLVPLCVLWVFSDFIASKPVRSVLLFLIAAGTILSLPELFLYYGGDFIRDHAKGVIIMDTALESPLANISMIPLLTVIAFFAPARLRGTWFAVGTSLLNLSLTGSQLLSKYLNLLFPVSRQVIDASSGAVLSPGDYSNLGSILVVKIIFMLIVPLAVVFLCLKKEDVSHVKEKAFS